MIVGFINVFYEKGKKSLTFVWVLASGALMRGQSVSEVREWRHHFIYGVTRLGFRAPFRRYCQTLWH